MDEPEKRLDRDVLRVLYADDIVNRVSIAAAKRNRETERQRSLQRLREKVGLEPPPRNLRERILGRGDEPELTGLRAHIFGRWK